MQVFNLKLSKAGRMYETSIPKNAAILSDIFDKYNLGKYGDLQYNRLKVIQPQENGRYTIIKIICDLYIIRDNVTNQMTTLYMGIYTKYLSDQFTNAVVLRGDYGGHFKNIKIRSVVLPRLDIPVQDDLSEIEQIFNAEIEVIKNLSNNIHNSIKNYIQNGNYCILIDEYIVPVNKEGQIDIRLGASMSEQNSKLHSMPNFLIDIANKYVTNEYYRYDVYIPNRYPVLDIKYNDYKHGIINIKNMHEYTGTEQNTNEDNVLYGNIKVESAERHRLKQYEVHCNFNIDRYIDTVIAAQRQLQFDKIDQVVQNEEFTGHIRIIHSSADLNKQIVSRTTGYILAKLMLCSVWEISTGIVDDRWCFHRYDVQWTDDFLGKRLMNFEYADICKYFDLECEQPNKPGDSLLKLDQTKVVKQLCNYITKSKNIVDHARYWDITDDKGKIIEVDESETFQIHWLVCCIADMDIENTFESEQEAQQMLKESLIEIAEKLNRKYEEQLEEEI